MKLERLLAIVMLLVNRRRMQAQELADRFEVSVRTIYRDIEAINQAGIPIITYQGAGGGIGVAEGFRMDRNFLTADELSSVFIALRGATTYHDQQAETVLEKLRTLVPESQADSLRAKTEHTVVDLSPWGRSPALQQRIALLKEAILTRHRVSFEYSSMKGETRGREVEPYVLVLKGHHWYLYGFCLLRQGFRLFKLARMRHLTPLANEFCRREIDLSAAPWEQSDGAPANLVSLVLRFHPGVRAYVEDSFDAEAVRTDEAGRCIVRVTYPEDNWVYGYLLSFGPSLEVLEPAHVRRRLADMAAGILANYVRTEAGSS